MSANYTIDIIVGTVVCLKIHYPKMSWFYGSQEFKPHPEHRRRGELKVVSNWELQISMPCHLSFVRPFAFFGGVTNFETRFFRRGYPLSNVIPAAEYVHFGVTATLYWVDSSFLCHLHLGSTI
jgi:hypothetical protein